jgi:alkylated DNA nucleotide flippase Atl1
MAPIKITATVGAYVTEYRDAATMVEALEKGRGEYVVGNFLAYAGHDMSKTWTRVGTAEITVTLASRDEQVQAAVKALNGQLESARAEFMEKQAQIMERISKLQALEYVEAQ